MAKVRLGRRECEDGRLPRICMCCGAASEVEISKKFSWTPPWVGVLILLGLLPYIIAAAVTTERCTALIPLCKQHASHWSWRTLFTLLSFLAVMVIGGMLFFLFMNLE